MELRDGRLGCTSRGGMHVFYVNQVWHYWGMYGCIGGGGRVGGWWVGYGEQVLVGDWEALYISICHEPIIA